MKIKRLLLCLVMTLGLLAGGVAVAKPSFSGGGRSSAGSGSRSAPAPSRPSPPPSRPPASPPPSRSSGSNSGGSNSGGSGAQQRQQQQQSPPPSARPRARVDEGAAKAAKVDSSRRDVTTVRDRPASNYQPKPQYRAPNGVARPINASDPSVVRLRSNYTYNVYTTRTTRYTSVFGPSYVTWGHPSVIYTDPINPFFYGWMMSSALNSEQRATWAYNHRAEIDDARYREMCAKDALLEAKIRELEAKGVTRDPSYTPKGVDPDLQYTDDYVKAATGLDDAERDVQAAEARLRDAQRDSDRAEARTGGGIHGDFCWGVTKFFMILLLVALGVWIVISLVRFATQD